MAELLLILQLAIEVAFALLAIRTAVGWIRDPDRRHGYLALGLGSLALVILISPLMGAGLEGQTATDATLVLFLLSGYGFVRFRDTFVPYSRSARIVLTAILVIIGVAGVAVALPADPARAGAASQVVVLCALVGAWAYCLIEPATTFWLASRKRPAVERARLHSITLGYAGLLAVVVIGTLGGSLRPVVTLVVDVLALAIVPLLYVAFFPPVWIRRVWRQPEEDQLRLAIHDLLLYSPDRVTLARRALLWAERLVGGDAAFVVDSDRSVLAARGISEENATRLTAKTDLSRIESNGEQPWQEGPMLVIPLDMQPRRGAIVIISSRVSPLLGDDEIGRLRQYATSISAGLDRVSLSSRIAALERAKTEFLNIASHELRGPMTVIKGYLTMLESGALGELAPKVQSVLPLLISKSDEINWMIEQMIEASRLEEGRLTLKTRRRDIVELTDSAVEGLNMLLGGHEVKVDEPPLPIEADVDPDRFQIVIRNLLSNAAKYSPSGTEITVRVRRNGKSAAVSVTDEGVGISPEDQRNLFTRFGRLTSTQHVQGTGLGLWLSREIARMHHGDLTVESKVGAGSTFTFTVPLTE